MLKRIAIDNYRCFSNFEYKPARINLLLGSNGSGKSSFMDLLTSAVDLVVQGADVAEAFPSATLTRWDKRTRQRIELDVEGNGGVYSYALVVQHSAERERPFIESETVTREGKTLFCFAEGLVHLHRNDGSEGTSFPFRGARSFLAQVQGRPETMDLMWFLRFLEHVWVLRLEARSVGCTSDKEEDALTRDGSNFASWYRHLSQESPEHLQDLWSALKKVIPGFQWMKLVSSGGKGRVRDLMVGMEAGGQTYDVDFDELSDGQRALTILYALLEGLRSESMCLSLDEPEAHVGLSEVQPWLVELDEHFEDQGQVFVAALRAGASALSPDDAQSSLPVRWRVAFRGG